jgi:preprotein translocase subunit Sss1
MITPELLRYIENVRKTGISDEQIRIELAKAGWSPEDINQVLIPTPPPPPNMQGAASVQGTQTAGTGVKPAKKGFSKAFVVTLTVLVILGIGYAVYFFFWPSIYLMILTK